MGMTDRLQTLFTLTNLLWLPTLTSTVLTLKARWSIVNPGHRTREMNQITTFISPIGIFCQVHKIAKHSTVDITSLILDAEWQRRDTTKLRPLIAIELKGRVFRLEADSCHQFKSDFGLINPVSTLWPMCCVTYICCRTWRRRKNFLIKIACLPDLKPKITSGSNPTRNR